MSTAAQIAANQANAQKSSGPKTPEGKTISSLNRLRHGLTGGFALLEGEDPAEYNQLHLNFQDEHKPTSFSEEVLVERMAQHHWLRLRSLELQRLTLEDPDRSMKDRERSLALYLRYQTTNERAFSKCLSDLLKLRSERRKAQIGFESHQLKQADQARKQSIENRKLDLHKMEVFLAEGKAEHQQLLNSRLETPEMRIPNRIQRILERTQAA